MTVSRVINGEGNVRDTTRERVNAVIRKLNYSPSAAARRGTAHRPALQQSELGLSQ
jgi:DNA-binding LacI/PurR family transcriptional regulator